MRSTICFSCPAYHVRAIGGLGYTYLKAPSYLDLSIFGIRAGFGAGFHFLSFFELTMDFIGGLFFAVPLSIPDTVGIAAQTIQLGNYGRVAYGRLGFAISPVSVLRIGAYLHMAVLLPVALADVGLGISIGYRFPATSRKEETPIDPVPRMQELPAPTAETSGLVVSVISTETIFPVLYQHYGSFPIGRIRLENHGAVAADRIDIRTDSDFGRLRAGKSKPRQRSHVEKPDRGGNTPVQECGRAFSRRSGSASTPCSGISCGGGLCFRKRGV